MDTSRSGLGEEGKVRLYPRVGAYLNGGPAAALLVGSIAVKVLEKCAAPVLIVKEKGETLNLLEALLPH